MQTVRPPQLSINYTKVLVVLRVGSKGKINGFLNHLYNYMCNLPAFALSQVGIRQTTQLLHIWQFQWGILVCDAHTYSGADRRSFHGKSLIIHPRLVYDWPQKNPCLVYNYWCIEMEGMSAICCIRIFICSFFIVHCVSIIQHLRWKAFNVSIFHAVEVYI